MENQFLRTEMVLGADGMDALRRSHVAVFGLGGVGSYAVEALVRSGVGELTLIDDDAVALTNLNRQLEALHSTLGQSKAEAIAAFLHQTGMTQEAVAAQLGMSPSALANKLRLLRLSPACRALLVEHGLTERHARCLLRLEDEGERLTALRQAAAKHWNVAQTEQYVERRLAALQTAPPAGRRTYIIKDVRLFLNSVDRGLRLIRDAGVDARTEREETEDEIVLTLRIPKQRRKEA